jgi:hypothetical protein
LSGMDASANAAPHRPLSSSDPSEIRLVKLYPGGPKDTVRCTLEHVSLKTDPEFVALSYTWGDPSVTSPIFLDGREYQVTTNLKSFLQHMQVLLAFVVRIQSRVKDPALAHRQAFLQKYLSIGMPNLPASEIESGYDSKSSKHGRYPHESETIFLCIWIDAICINQTDISERNLQVRNMKNIYRSATSTYVWLGDYPDSSGDELDNAFELIMVISQTATEDHVEFSDLEQLAPFVFAQSDMIKRELAEWGDYLSKEEIGQRCAANHTISRLLRRSWYSRPWIVQEFVLSQGSVTAWCGYHHIAWNILPIVSLCCEDLRGIYESPEHKPIEILPKPSAAAARLLMISEWHRALDEDHPMADDNERDYRKVFASRWLELMGLMGGNFYATEPHDAVYACLGLLESVQIPPEISIDYSLSWGQVCHQVSSFLLRNASNSVAHLLEATPLENPEKLPSWVTNLQEIETHDLQTAPVLAEVSNDGRELNVWGHRIGRVQALIKEYIPTPAPELKRMVDMISTLGKSLTTLEEKCWQRSLFLNPRMQKDQFRQVWAELWQIDESHMHFYDILTGRKAPGAHEMELGFLGSTLFDTVPLIQIYSEPGIGSVDGGHLVTDSLVRPMKEQDVIFKLTGVSRPLILRRRPECQAYEFVGVCRGYSWSEGLGEEWDKIRKSERVTLS